MESKTQTTIGELQPGDRFYFLKDKKKTVWQKIEHEVKRTHFQTYSNFAKQDGQKYEQPFKRLTEVIFLRHTT